MRKKRKIQYYTFLRHIYRAQTSHIASFGISALSIRESKMCGKWRMKTGAYVYIQ